VLEKDHRKTSELFELILDGNPDRPRDEIFQDLKKELLIHAKAEEEVFYAPLQQQPQAQGLIPEAIAEHTEMEQKLRQLDQMSKNSPEWETQLRTLQQSVMHHVKEEEGKIFNAAKKCFTELQVNQMGQQMEAKKLQLLESGALR
ncbi:MAG TPA: hemerythrin domain-containing protein, partial [bacterium]|nr:hemerythrin domain-containing protein [bacterium]